MSSKKISKVFNCRQIIDYGLYDKKSITENYKLLKNHLAQETNWFKNTLEKALYKSFINVETNRILKMSLDENIFNSSLIFTDINARRLFQAFTMLDTDLDSPIFKSLICFDISNYILTRSSKEICNKNCNLYIEFILRRLREYCLWDNFIKELCIIDSAKRYFEERNWYLMQKIRTKSIDTIFTSLEFQYFIEALKHGDERISKILIFIKKLSKFPIKYVDFNREIII